MGRVDGKVAVVTGAGSGIGAACARLLAAEGASVVVADINPTGADDTTATITASGKIAMALEVDVSEEAEVQRMVSATVDRFGRLDVLHNNAALTGVEHGRRDTAVADLELEVWESAFAVNVRGAMLGCKHAIPRMLEVGGGSIINTSSMASETMGLDHTAYNSSKAAVNALTRCVATQYGRFGIRCNAVLPGLILSPSTQANLSPQTLAGLVANNLTPYAGEPADIAAMVLYLASDESRYVTGQLLRVNGGADAHRPDYAQLIGAVHPA